MTSRMHQEPLRMEGYRRLRLGDSEPYGLWLVIKGAKPPAVDAAASSSAAV